MIAMCTRREIKASRRAVCLDERGDQPDDPDGDPDPFDVPVNIGLHAIFPICIVGQDSSPAADVHVGLRGVPEEASSGCC